MTTGVILTAMVYATLMCFAAWLAYIAKNDDDNVE